MAYANRAVARAVLGHDGQVREDQERAVELGVDASYLDEAIQQARRLR